VFVKKISDCEEFIANDGCQIRELMHPENDPVELPYSIAIASVEVGKQTYKHRLKQTEVYYVLAGQGCMHIDDETQLVSEGDGILIPAKAVQWIENTGDRPLRFVAIVSPPWPEADDERLE
jgi:mannose-6-phosphate isomerase-like protein (cupin superfamily)